MAEWPARDELITVGRVVSVYGIKGWVKIRSYTEPYERLMDYAPHWLEVKGQPGKTLQAIEIDGRRVQGQGLIAHLKGVDDRDQARAYCQRDLLVRKSALPPLEEGEYYWHQLEGLKVYSSFGGLGNSQPKLLGTVSRMMETGANDVMVVSPCEGSLDKRERLLPFLLDHYATEIDMESGRLTMEWDPDF